MSDDLDALKSELRQFVADRDWDQFHDAKNLVMCLAAEVGELIAELRWVDSSGVTEAVRDPARRERMRAELGDVMLSVLMLADSLGMDIVEATRSKMHQNAIKYPTELVRGTPESPPRAPIRNE